MAYFFIRGNHMKFRFLHYLFKAHLFLIVFLTAFISNQLTAQEEYTDQPYWSRIPGASSEEVTYLEITEDQDIYACVWGYGLHKSTDLGTSWQDLTGNLENLYINAIEITESGMYVGTYGDGIYYSTGDGNWDKRNTGLTNLNVKALIAHNGKIYAGTLGSGIFISTDNGQNWEQSIQSMWYLDINDLFVSSNGDILAATNGGGIYRSTNEGEIWMHSSAGLENKTVTCFAQNETGQLYCGTMGGGIYESVNNGVSWAVYNANSMPYFISDIEMINERDPMVATYNDGMWYYSWLYAEWLKSELTAFGVNSLIKADNGNFFAALPNRGIQVSTNEGQTWRTVEFQNTIIELVINAFENIYVFSSDFSASYMSTDNGVTWETLNIPGSPIVNSFGQDSSGNYFCCTNEGLFISVDNGNTWNLMGLGDETVTSIACAPDGTLYAGCLPNISQEEEPPPEPQFYRSTDNGNSWDLLYDGYSPINVLAAGHQNEIYWKADNEFKVSTDQGDTYNAFPNLNANSIDIASNGDAVISASDGNKYTDDLGATWTPFFIDYKGTYHLLLTESDNIHYYKAYDDNFDHVGMIRNEYQTDVYDTLNAGLVRARVSGLSDSESGFIFLGNSCLYRGIDAVDIDVPEPISPAPFEIGVDVSPTFKWSKVENAVLYEFQISPFDDFEGIVEHVVLSDTSRKLQRTLDHSRYYYWRVRGKTNRSHGEWSQVKVFSTIIEAPLLASPDSASGGHPLSLPLKWHPVEGADRYNLEVSDDEDFSNIIEKATVEDDTLFTISGLELSSVYYWRVKALSGEIESDWSVVWNFKTMIGAPALRLPEHESLNHAIEALEMQWEEVANAEDYQLQVAYDEEFSNLLIDSTGLTSNEFDLIDTLKYYTQYFWRVRAFDEYGESDWSEVWNFTTVIGPPQLASPANTAVDIEPEEVRFLWGKFNDATTYHIQVAEDRDMENIVFEDDRLYNNSVPVFDLDYFTKYYWRVKIISFDHVGLWSDVWEFTTGLSSPLLTAPDSNATDVETQVYLQWENVTGKEEYELLVSTDKDFNDIVLSSEDIKVNFKIVNDLEYETEYFWKVRAVYQYGNGPWSNVWNFTTEEDHSSVFDGKALDIVNIIPNPFRGSVEIKYELRKPANVSVEIFDILGSKVLEKPDTYRKPGSYSIKWKPNGSPGMYYVVIQIDGRKYARKAVYLQE